MKKLKIFLIVSPILFIGLIVLGSFLQTTYKDGTYTGRSRSHYTNEPYVGEVKIDIKGGEITKINFAIIDTAKKELFDEKYEKYFANNPLYVDQCRKDYKGVQMYPGKLLEAQHIEKIDAVSGATWSYNIFKASVNEALKNAKK